MIKKVLLITFIIFVVIQFIQVQKINKDTPKELEIKVPQNISAIFKKACYDCHSNNTVWPWYSKIAPFSWTIASHVNDGRKALNFSIWQEYNQEKKNKKLREIFRTIYASMPLKSYIIFHREANLSKKERKEVRNFIGIKR